MVKPVPWVTKLVSGTAERDSTPGRPTTSEPVFPATALRGVRTANHAAPSPDGGRGKAHKSSLRQVLHRGVNRVQRKHRGKTELCWGEGRRAGRAFKDRYFKDIRLLQAWEAVETLEAGKRNAPLENVPSSHEADIHRAGGEGSKRHFVKGPTVTLKS